MGWAGPKEKWRIPVYLLDWDFRISLPVRMTPADGNDMRICFPSPLPYLHLPLTAL